MESLDLTYKLVDLKVKVKHLTKSTLCLKYSRNIENLYIFAATPSLSRRGRGCCNPHPPPPTPNFFHGNIFLNTWVSAQRVGKLTEWQS